MIVAEDDDDIGSPCGSSDGRKAKSEKKGEERDEPDHGDYAIESLVTQRVSGFDGAFFARLSSVSVWKKAR